MYLSKEHWEGELLHTRKDGEPIVVMSYQALRRNARGEPDAILEIDRDITAQKRASEAMYELNEELENKVAERTSRLQEINAILEEEIVERRRLQELLLKNQAILALSEVRYRGIIQNMQNYFAYYKVILGKDGNPIDLEYVEANEAFEKLSGLKVAEILWQRLSSTGPAFQKDQEAWTKLLGKVALTGEPVSSEVFLKKYNSYFRVVVYSPEPGYVASITEDITDRKNAEEAPRESREWYKTVLAKSTEAVAVISLSEREIIEVNGTFPRIFGYLQGELSKILACFL